MLLINFLMKIEKLGKSDLPKIIFDSQLTNLA